MSGGIIINCFINGLFCRDPDGSPTGEGLEGPDWATDEYDELSSLMWRGSKDDIIEGDSRVKFEEMPWD